MSTLGGFLMGFGVAFVVMAALGFVVYLQYQPALVEYKTKIEAVYRVTHSEQYAKVISGLEKISPTVQKIADLIQKYGWIIGVQDVGRYLSYVPTAVSWLRDLRDVVEASRNMLETLEAVPTYLALVAIVGMAMLTASAVVVYKRKAPSTQLSQSANSET